MRKVALVFVVAVLAPSLVLAWLAVRSLRDQQFVVERQRALLYQGVADTLARDLNEYLTALQRNFGLEVDRLLLDQDPGLVADSFDQRLRASWPGLPEVGFVVSLDGRVLSPSTADRPASQRFLEGNGLFLSNRGRAEVYANTVQQQVFIPPQAAEPSPLRSPTAETQPPEPAPQSIVQRYGLSSSSSRPSPRNVIPNQGKRAATREADEAALSKLVTSETEFRQLAINARDGTIARFLQNQLCLLFWHRPTRDTNLIFGAQIDLAQLTATLQPLVEIDPPALRSDIAVALLNDQARPVGLTPPGFSANWKRPFAAAEIGETLPHWEIAVYLLDPEALSRSVRAIRLTLGLLILVLVCTIGTGGWLIVRDLGRQLTLARQKSDFVSNVSHELKTPLTSIRMFAELLAQDRVTDPARRRQYLDIITAEAARLTRLINNVLDFARLERGRKKYRLEPCDLAALAQETAETFRPHLEAARFTLEIDAPDAPLLVSVDRDAIAQIIVNLLSNAEKYSGDRREIRVEARRADRPLPHLEVRVLDRGPGIPAGCEELIFDQFYRAHNALDSGIQGSGLGLTLARQIARAHGGEVEYKPRAGGGSCFALRLPPLRSDPPADAAA